MTKSVIAVLVVSDLGLAIIVLVVGAAIWIDGPPMWLACLFLTVPAQIGSLAIWVFVPMDFPKWPRVVIALVGSVAAGHLLHVMTYNPAYNPALDTTAIWAKSILGFLSISLLTMGGLACWHLLKRWRRPSSTASPALQFRVAHLLLAMLLVALLGALIKVALPALTAGGDLQEFVTVFAQVTLLALAAGIFFSEKIHLVVGVACVVVTGFLLTIITGIAAGEEVIGLLLFFNAIQVAVYFVAVGLPRFDRRG